LHTKSTSKIIFALIECTMLFSKKKNIMQKVPYIWKNGKFLNWDDAKTHLITHTLHYSAGAFEGIRFYDTKKGPAIFRLKEHTKRLFYSAKALDMKMQYSQKEINEAIIKLIKKNKIKKGYIRPLVYYGEGRMGLSTKGFLPDTMIAAWGWGSYLGEHAVRVKISKYMRIHPASTVSDAKLCGHYTNSILASIDAYKNGYDEALLLDYKGHVAEGPGENIFMVKQKTIYTPSVGTILPGITRDAIMTLARDLGYKVVEKNIKPEELKRADEAFFTGTAAEVSPISSIDGKKLKLAEGGPVTMHLKEEFLKIVNGENKKYSKWLTVVQ